MITTDFHVAVPTAFTADEELDIEKTIHHIRFLQTKESSPYLYAVRLVSSTACY